MQRHFTPDSLLSPQNQRGRNPIGEQNPLMERFYQEQLKNRSKLPLDRAYDEHQREIFISMDKAAQRMIEQEAQRERELKNIVLNENKAMIEKKEREKKQKQMEELREAQERNNMAVRQFEEERRREQEKKSLMMQVQAQDLNQQIIQKHASGSWNPHDELKHQMISSMNHEVQSQIQAKQAYRDRQKLEMERDRQKAAFIDQRDKDIDEQARLKRIHDQETLKAELDKQILKKNNARSMDRLYRNDIPRRQEVYNTILNPVSSQHKPGKGRGYFSPISQVANNIFGN